MAAKSHKNGSRVIPPGELTPQLAKIAIEEVLLDAAADIAALTASTGNPPGPAVMIAETPEEAAILKLIGVPFLGPVRLRALAAIGINTIEDLRAASTEEIGSVKGVGMVNAKRIKDWLDRNHPAKIKAVVKPRALDSLPKQTLVASAKSLASSATPPPPPDLQEVFTPAEASLEVLAVQDELRPIDQAINKLKAVVPDDKRKKKLSKELEKLAAALSEAPESAGMLPASKKAKAAKALDKIAKLLTEAVEKEKFSDKRQSAIGAELKDLRKRLEKSLG